MFILGSSSPRRKELFHEISNDFIIMKPTFDEDKIPVSTPNYPLEQARHKANSIKHKIKPDDCLICCDTIVKLGDKIFGKPKNKKESYEMLRELSSNTHEVISGYCIIYKNHIIVNEVTSQVTFNYLSDELINSYINGINTLDKAGAYALQDDLEYHLIKSVRGSIYNVIGLPLEAIKKDLLRLGLIK